jgi:hypothetical protein
MSQARRGADERRIGAARRRIRSLAAAVWLATASTAAWAGAWTEAKGHGQLIFTVSGLRSTSGYGTNGEASPFSNGGEFQQIANTGYLAVGVTNRLTLVLNWPEENLRYADHNGEQKTSGGFGDLEIAGRLRLNHPESPWVMSGQFTVSVPGYKASADPSPGNHQEDVEGRFLLGRGFNLGERHGFVDLEGAYRLRTAGPADQLRGDATVGIDTFRRVTVLGQVFSIKGLRNGSGSRSNSNPNAQSDFDLYKAQGSFVVAVRPRTNLQFGWNTTVGGRNTGRGSSVLVGLWQRF